MTAGAAYSNAALLPTYLERPEFPGSNIVDAWSKTEGARGGPQCKWKHVTVGVALGVTPDEQRMLRVARQWPPRVVRPHLERDEVHVSPGRSELMQDTAPRVGHSPKHG